eukprot:2014901-Pleurochrysis_carterae.AAC.1
MGARVQGRLLISRCWRLRVEVLVPIWVVSVVVYCGYSSGSILVGGVSVAVLTSTCKVLLAQ